MKRILCLVSLTVVCAAGRIFAADPLADVFREGLFEEEANRNLPAAITAYEEVVRRLDEQRRLAATSVFRLGECHRKLGQTNEAIAAFERVVREFPAEETLVKLSRENLTLLRPPEIPVPRVAPQPAATGSETVNMAARIAALSAQLATITNAPNGALMAEAALAVTADAPLGELLGARLTLEQELAAKQVNYSVEHPEVRVLTQRLKTVSHQIDERVSTLRTVQELQIGALKQAQQNAPALTPATARDQQRALLQDEIALVEKQLESHRRRADVGAASWEESVPLQRDLLSLRRELARLEAGTPRLPDIILTPPEATPASNAAAAGLVLREIQLIEEQLAKLEARTTDRVSPGAPEVISLKRDRLRLQRQLPQNAGANRRQALFEEEIALVQEALKNQQILVQAGRAESGTVLSLERELLALERQMAAVQETPGITAAADSGITPATSEEAEEIRRIQALVANSPDLINAPGEGRLTPLAAAARKGQLAVARYLLDHGARVDDTSSQPGYPPLHFAVEAGHRTMAELLLDRGAAVTPPMPETPLHTAAEKGFVSLAELLVAKGADVDHQTSFSGKKYATPLWLAVNRDKDPMAAFLLDHGADPNLSGTTSNEADFSTPLTEARSLSMLRLLLDHGADPNADTSARLTKAVDEKDAEALTLLLDAGAKVNVQAIALGHRKDGRYGPLTGSERVRTPLSFAISKGWMEGARLLREHGADVNLADDDDRGAQWAPLHFAVSRTNLEAVRWLVSEGADVAARDALGRSALELVVSEAAPSLLGAGAMQIAAALLPGEESPTPADRWEVVLVLVKAGADPMTSADGYPLIHHAVAAGRIEVVDALKERGVNLDARGSGMITPLMVAVGMNQADVLEWLLKHGADVNLQDEDGNTALHFAAWKRSPSLAKRLLEAGASRAAVNLLGMTPVQLADDNPAFRTAVFGLARMADFARGAAGLPRPSVRQVPIPLPAAAPSVRGQSAYKSELTELLTPEAPVPIEPDK
ncbi:MAG: ankyrin repeat domain-containing protein [Verrucomicrobiales bacterium]|nr:ankyrin repeat domain-containing protein [Verrucomicrobiales bacterium]